jgi:16S rRNA (guanine1207-N2)-methyltransferase
MGPRLELTRPRETAVDQRSTECRLQGVAPLSRMGGMTPDSLSESPFEAALRPQEQLLIAAIDDLFAGKVLCNTAGRAQFAREMAVRYPTASVTCLLLDVHQQQQAIEFGVKPKNLRILCQEDPPNERYDVVALALNRSGEAELARDLLQAGHVRLTDGGQMVATTDNPRDSWLQQQMETLFPRVSRRASELGVTYTGTKQGPLKRIRRFEAEFAFRDGDRLLKLRTRPGVFSHRHVDGGARALLETMQVTPGMRVLDIGTGSGVVAVAAAARAEDVSVVALDSNARAVEAVRWAAAANGLSGIRAELDALGTSIAAGAFDLAIANPPYYSNFRIADIFMRTATTALRPGGTVLVVTKRPDWYVTRLTEGFDNIRSVEVRRYFVVAAERTAAS